MMKCSVTVLLLKKLELKLFKCCPIQIKWERIIAVPDYLQNVKDLEKEERLTEDILWIKPDLSEYYYDKDAGFIRKDEKGS